MKLKDLGDYFIGLTYKPESVTNEGTIVLRSGNIQRGKFDLSDIVRVNINIRDKLYVKPGDILMCSRNGSAKLVGKSTVIPETDEPMTFGAFMTVFRTPYNDYLKFFFQSDSFRKQLQSSKTTTINQITINMLDSIDLELPEKSIREERSKILNRIQKIIDKREEEIGALDDLIKARFVEMFGKGQFPKKTLISLVKENAGLSYGIVQPGDDGTGDMGVLRPVDFIDGHISTKSIKYIDRSIGDGFKKTELTGNELLITVRGTTGITALTDERFAGMNVTRGIAVIRYDCNKINPVFLNAYLNSDESQRYIQDHTRGATLQQINLSDLRVQMITVPPMELQNKFAAFATQIDKSKSAIQKSLDETQLLFDSLMQQYFG